MREKRKYEFRGKVLTAREIADVTGIPQSVIGNRIYAGKRGEELAEPMMSRREAGKRAMAARRDRERKGETSNGEMTIEEVAEEMGISRTLVNNIERKGIENAREKLKQMGITKGDLL